MLLSSFGGGLCTATIDSPREVHEKHFRNSTSINILQILHLISSNHTLSDVQINILENH